MLIFCRGCHRLGGSLDRFCMSSDQRWKWAGIVSVISVGGVLITDIVANVVGGYISDQIKTWQVPIQPPAQNQAQAKGDAPAADAEPVSSIPAPANETQLTMAAVAPKPEPAPMPPVDIPPERPPEAATAPEPMPLPPEPQQTALTGTVDQVIDTGTLKIQGET